jgi:two-component sensor histidine kinase
MTLQKDDTPAPRILLLEDSDFDAELISEHATRIEPKPQILRAVGRKDYVSALEGGTCDVILSDYSLPDFDGMAALEIAKEKAPNTPFIFVSGVLGEEIAIESFKKGATDYVLKQRLIRLPAAIERALGEARERRVRQQAEEQMKLLVAELSHRVKNTLAMVMSIVRRTAAGSRSVAEYEQALASRVRALSDAHALLFEANWGNTDLKRVLERTLAPFRSKDFNAIRFDGPVVSLDPRAALTLSLVVHELVSNATKYGALSVGTGRVDVRWSATTNGTGQTVVFCWREVGGPPVTEPERTGFGRTLITRSVEYELEGTSQLRFEPMGLVCEIQFAAG